MNKFHQLNFLEYYEYELVIFFLKIKLSGHNLIRDF